MASTKEADAGWRCSANRTGIRNIVTFENASQNPARSSVPQRSTRILSNGRLRYASVSADAMIVTTRPLIKSQAAFIFEFPLRACSYSENFRAVERGSGRRRNNAAPRSRDIGHEAIF